MRARRRRLRTQRRASTAYRGAVAAAEAAFEAMNDGADAAYTLHSLQMVPKPDEF